MNSHAPYAEYRDLLRALHVQHTLDLASRLTDADRSYYTTWPLRAAEVVVPPWPLHDEITAFAHTILPNQPDLDDDDPEELDPLPDLVSNLISRLLATLCHSMLRDSDGLSTREHPADWQTVLNCVVDLVDADTFQRIKSRLEGLYGPSDSVLSLDEPSHFAQEFLSNKFRIPFPIIGTGFPDPLPPADPVQMRLTIKRERRARRKGKYMSSEDDLPDSKERSSSIGGGDSEPLEKEASRPPSSASMRSHSESE